MNWDKTLFFKINGLVGKNRALDIFSEFGGRFLLYFMMGFMPFIFIYDSFPYIGYIYMFLIFWLPALFVSLLVGLIVKRPRPYIAHKKEVKSLFVPLIGKWKSMPSDHALSCAVLVSMAVLSGSYYNVIIYIILSLWVCWGRVYGGVHYASDIVVGFLIGIIVPALLILKPLFYILSV